MHKEYAVEPAAIGQSWETFRYVIEKFGFTEGRLISKFPSAWPRLVMEAADAAGVAPVARKRIEEKLRTKKNLVLLKAGRNYDPNLPFWLDNAIASDAEKPFHAILVSNNLGGDRCISIDELEDTHPLIHVPRTADIPRTGADLAAACSLLLVAAREIDVIDPYLFRIENANTGYRETIRHLLGVLHNSGHTNMTVRLHYGNANNCPPESHVLQNASNWFHGLIPPTFSVRLTAWDEIQGGEDFHDRFILTDRGGIQIGSGLAAAGAQEHALITLLETQHSDQIRLRFAPESNVYRQFGRTVEILANGVVSAV